MGQRLQMVVCFPLRDIRGRPHTLLGEKVRKIGQGYLNGPGGKVENGESLHRAAIREFREELQGIRTRGTLAERARVFIHIDRVWEVTLAVFTIESTGPEAHEITSSDFIRFGWYPIDELPLEKLFGADAKWLPQVLKKPCGNILLFFRSAYDTDKAFFVPDRTGKLMRVTYEGIRFH